MNVEITFLGTASHTPTPSRNHTSILINYDSEKILVDCGEGTQRQFKIAGINMCKLTRILITHWHADHVLGLPGLLQTLYMSDYSKKLEIYGPKGTKRKIELLEKVYGNFKIKYIVKEILEGTFIDERSFKIEAKQMSHNLPALAYSFIIKDKIRIDKPMLKKFDLPNSHLIGELQKGKNITFKGKKIKYKEVTYIEEGKKISIVMDTEPNTNLERIAKKADLLICESTFHSKEEEKAKEYKHMTSKQAASLAKKAKTKMLALTHISTRYDRSTKDLLDEAKKIFPKTIIPKDFDKIKV